ncbi:MAG: pyruvate, water dikinase [Candidatus Abyssobacteria bacterium SURF_5]|uniref:Phosphoenolpyruvate synthase n=1 Tax=Abyssobacteria bacterium (strain SURF_5) TaxID=2093360 RepID=A0A3A4NNF8_ABYX5|nr:MAG: pyruvate, water dikinase [Candidatus Abyssubacteria bacterium SURF_5]
MLFEKLRALLRASSDTYQPDFSVLFSKFQQILNGNNIVLDIIAQMEDKLSGEYVFDMNYIRSSTRMMSEAVYKIIYALAVLSNNAYPELFSRYEAIGLEIDRIIEGESGLPSDILVLPLDSVRGDMEELVGSKAARLGEIRNQLDLPVPDGFIITTAAYRLFLQSNNLWPQIRASFARRMKGEISAVEYHESIEKLIGGAAMPPKLEKDIAHVLSSFFKKKGKKFSLAVRSSAWGEDSEVKSFAGQFKTLLSQDPAHLLSAYRKVISSRFSERALAYEGEDSIREEALPMAVICQEMVSAKVSGIIYSIDPRDGHSHKVLISSLYGLGEPAVSGRAEMDQFIVSRIHPYEICERKIARKQRRLVLLPNQEIRDQEVPKHEQERPSLGDSEIISLAEHALALERFLRQPQDVEWAIDTEGKCCILQTRPLSLHRQRPGRGKSLNESLKKYPVLLADSGQVVQRGVAAGKVVKVFEDADPSSFPQGAIAVTHFTTPRLTKIIRKTSAIITDVGSPTGHMATIAREFGVPTIVGTKEATRLLQDGMEITVDAEENRIYSGIVPEVLEYQIEGRDQFANLPEFKILRKVLNKVAPLNMIDPASPQFAPRNCHTFHDILRFCHEKAVWELINLHASQRRFRNIRSRELKMAIPLGLHLIDLGNGLSHDVGSHSVDSVDQVTSLPMRALLDGLASPGAWSTEPRPLRFNDFMSSLTRFSLGEAQPRYVGKNLAVISDHYTNLSLRLGYHFNVIDTYTSENINDNYIYFRFVGGVTDPERRHRRGLLIETILEKYDFKVIVRNDLVVARLKKRNQRELLETLVMLGKLIGFTRQLDTEMVSDKSIERFAAAFLQDVSH